MVYWHVIVAALIGSTGRWDVIVAAAICWKYREGTHQGGGLLACYSSYCCWKYREETHQGGGLLACYSSCFYCWKSLKSIFCVSYKFFQSKPFYLFLLQYLLGSEGWP